MEKKIIKQMIAAALSLMLLLGIMPIPASAIAYDSYEVSGRTQSGNNTAFINYGLTENDAGYFTIDDKGTKVQFNLWLNSGWYLEKWDTYFNGGEDIAIWSDPSVEGSNPSFGNDGYTFYNISQYALPINDPYITVRFLGSLYGAFRILAVVRPILSVNAGEGVSYEVTTDDPISTNSGVAVVYGNNASINYSVDEKHTITGISANYGTQYSDNGSAVTVSSIIRPATVTISSRLKQQKVNFDANGGTGTMVQQTFEYGVEQALASNTFEKDGYTFAGWASNADGTGITYTDGQALTLTPANDGESMTLYAQWTKDIVNCTVSFDPNGGAAIAPITVTAGEKYGSLPSSSVAGLSGGDSNWYLVDDNGNVTDTKITRLSTVEQERDHTLFVKRKVLAPKISLALSVPGGISDSYNYYIPGNSTRILTASVNNANTDILDYSYRWYKDGTLIENENGTTLTLPGNVSDAGTYKVEVTATLKDGTGIIVTSDAASGEKELTVKILHAANELKYDANGGEGGPSANYTGGDTATVSADKPIREHYVFSGWNTRADGSGASYAPGAAYIFAADGGNGGCVTTLYAQWMPETKTVTYQVDGEVFRTDTVEYGKDAVLPDVPAKEGHTGKWDHDGKNITEDTVISAVYTVNQYTLTFMDENGVYATQTYKHGEKVTMPDVPVKEGYTVTWDTTVEIATDDATVRAVYTEKSTDIKPADSPKTGDNSKLWLCVLLMALSAAGVMLLCIGQRKRKEMK